MNFLVVVSLDCEHGKLSSIARMLTYVVVGARHHYCYDIAIFKYGPYSSRVLVLLLERVFTLSLQSCQHQNQVCCSELGFFLNYAFCHVRPPFGRICMARLITKPTLLKLSAGNSALRLTFQQVFEMKLVKLR